MAELSPGDLVVLDLDGDHTHMQLHEDALGALSRSPGPFTPGHAHVRGVYLVLAVEVTPVGTPLLFRAALLRGPDVQGWAWTGHLRRA